MERKLASIKRITEIRAIPDADAVELAIVGGGWPVVTRKGEYSVGDLACYFEIDSWVPNAIAPFLSGEKKPREYHGVKGERLRTKKIRGQISQGLLLHPDNLQLINPEEGVDLTEFLNIQKWEMPVNSQLQGQQKGNFPHWLRKTDQERVQNLDGYICWDDSYQITVKLDGSSMTVYKFEGEIGVCSRNVDLNMDQEGNAFVNMARIIHSSIEIPEGFAVQGELMGPKIQGNREGFDSHVFFVFDIWSITDQRHLPPAETLEFCTKNGLHHVPVLADCVPLRLAGSGIDSIESCLQYAEGKSINHPVREGVVFKRVDGSGSFKAISNKYLLAEK